MKKYVLFGFAAAMTLASCTQSEVLETAIESPMEFSSFVNKSTKAPITADNITNSVFAVWGYKYKTSGTPATIVPVFENVPVKYDKTLSIPAWIYNFDGQPIRYWDKTCTYDFYAYAPSSVNASISTVSKGAATMTVTGFEVSNTTYTDHTDLMVADPIKGTVDYANKQQFTFNHKLTKVNMKIKKASTLSNDVVKLVSATFKGVANKADFTYVFGTSGLGSWVLSEETSDKVDFPAVLTNLSESVIAESESLIFTDLLMIPQSISSDQFEINYTINNEPFSKTLNLASTWGINESYLYTLTIDASAIEFSATVNEWTETTNNNTTTTVKDQN